MTTCSKDTTESVTLGDLTEGVIIFRDGDGLMHCQSLGDADILKIVGLIEWARSAYLKKLGGFKEDKDETSKVQCMVQTP